MGLEDYKEKSPYRGMWVSVLVLIIVPLVVYIILRILIMRHQPWFGEEMNLASAKALGCGVGVLFHLACIFAGALHESFMAVLTRIGNFFSNLTISFKLAVSCYKHDFRDLGGVFWIYFAIIGLNAYLCADGLLDFLKLYMPSLFLK